MSIGTLPFNPTCNKNINRVVCEESVISINKKCVLALEGPFFTKTLEVSFTNTQGQTRNLNLGLDYVHAYPLVKSGSDVLREHITCGIVLDPTLVGSVALSYNALGGNLGISQSMLTTLELDATKIPEVTGIEDVLNINELPNNGITEISNHFGDKLQIAINQLSLVGMKLVMYKL
jgi:hypothetical protein